MGNCSSSPEDNYKQNGYKPSSLPRKNQKPFAELRNLVLNNLDRGVGGLYEDPDFPAAPHMLAKKDRFDRQIEWLRPKVNLV